LPRDLSDVLHYFMPEAEPEQRGDAGKARSSPAPAGELATPALPAALPLVAVPIGDRDVVRAAFTWNLVVEIARLGGKASLVVAGESQRSPLFPASGIGAMGAEVIRVRADSLEELQRAALETAASRATTAAEGGVVFVRIAPTWLREARRGAELLRWALLFSSSDPRDLLETYGMAKLILAGNSRAHIGVTVHGARSLGEAEESFGRLSASARRHLDHELQSYGLIVDDLDVYRAIVAQRAIGLAHPQSPAARALRDIARMLADHARHPTLA